VQASKVSSSSSSIGGSSCMQSRNVLVHCVGTYVWGTVRSVCRRRVQFGPCYKLYRR
jgi:hypothetical protein